MATTISTELETLVTLPAMLSPQHARVDRWEAVIVGAGPAGALTAYFLASAGWRVLLVEKKSFPRDKVCGGCVGRQAIELLTRAGLAANLRSLPYELANRLQLHAGSESTQLPISPVMVISRAELDAALVQAAIAAGAQFMPNTVATVGGCDQQQRSVLCRRSGEEAFEVTAEIVIAADGLAHTSLSRLAEMKDRAARYSRVGLGAIVNEDDAWCTSRGIAGHAIQMVIGHSGYVGLARSQPGRLHVAAAIKPGALADRIRPTEALAQIFSQAGKVDWAERVRTQWSDSPWCGTPLLTHGLNKVSAERLFVLGDAAAYVEPFTGEGITWALQAAQNLTTLLASQRACASRSAELEWQSEYPGFLRRKSRACRVLAAVLRLPRLAPWAVYCMDAMPSCSAMLVRLLNGPPQSLDDFRYEFGSEWNRAGNTALSNLSSRRV